MIVFTGIYSLIWLSFNRIRTACIRSSFNKKKALANLRELAVPKIDGNV